MVLAAIFSRVGKAVSAKYISNPIFVVGPSRSGTSVLLQALGKHPKILSSPGEAPFLTSIGGAVASFELNHNKRYYEQSLICTKSHLYEQLKKLAIETTNGEHYGLKNYVNTCLSRRQLVRATHWSAKTFPTQRGADALKLLFPGASFVYIVRNGLEVVQSMTKHGGFRGNAFYENCRTWGQSIETFGYLVDYDTAYTVRHEDLIEAPDILFERLFEFLDLLPNPHPAAFVKNTVVHPLDRQTEQKTSAKHEFRERPPPYATWTAEQRKTFVENCGAAMEKLGYEIPF
jgi:hypothetical protein